MTVPSNADRPACLVEACWGLGDMVQATPLCRALWILGFDVDLLLSVPPKVAAAVAPLFRASPPIRRVFEDMRGIDFRGYAFGVCCFGEVRARRRLRPGYCLAVRGLTRLTESLSSSNLRPARLLGYTGPVPPSVATFDDRDAALPAGSVVVHAGCDPQNRLKRWSGWAEICARLRAKGHHVVVVGTDADLSESGWERAHDCRFGRPLPQVAALLRAAHAYLGNDSGVGHVAGAAGTPGLLLFGPSRPEMSAPNSDAIRVLAAPAHEGEERHVRSARPVPIDRLDVASVWSAVTRLLEEARPDPPRPLPEPRPRPLADPTARLPTVEEARDAPPTREALDDLQRRVFAAAVHGHVARTGRPLAQRALARSVAEVAGIVHMRAADARFHEPGRTGYLTSYFHLREAWRAGFRARPLTIGLGLGLRFLARGRVR